MILIHLKVQHPIFSKQSQVPRAPHHPPRHLHSKGSEQRSCQRSLPTALLAETKATSQPHPPHLGSDFGACLVVRLAWHRGDSRHQGLTNLTDTAHPSFVERMELDGKARRFYRSEQTRRAPHLLVCQAEDDPLVAIRRWQRLDQRA